jgi:hypothetical protein
MNGTTLMFKGLIASLPKENQEEVFRCYDEMKQSLDSHAPLGVLALGWLASEQQEEG